MWEDVLHTSCYESENKVKKYKIQVYIIQFESLMINEGRDIAKIFLCMESNVINIVRGIYELLGDSFVV